MSVLNTAKCLKDYGENLMNHKKYSLKYIPIFESNLYSAAEYISNTFNNKQSAVNLINETENAILKRLENPISFEPYHSTKLRKIQVLPNNIENYSVSML